MASTNVQFTVAAHIMATLGYHYGKEVTSATLADSVNADPSFVRRVLSKLSKAKLVVTTKGRTGACSLARPPAEITLLDIYRASEAPPTFSIHSYPEQPKCPMSMTIKRTMASVLEGVQAGVEQHLAGQTLSELIAAGVATSA
jgi:Rrf2 family protein